MNKISTAIVGLGRIASLLEDDSLREKPCTHAGAITANDDCLLVAGSDTDEERRRLFEKRWQLGGIKPAVYADAAQMLQIHKPQILAIATHPDSHYHYCRLAAEHGVSVVICEKPLADTVKEARKIVRLEKNGFTIITNHERRYSQDYTRAKTVLGEGQLGGLLSVRCVLYMGLTRRLLDVFWHDGTHLADALMFITGAELKHKKRRGVKLKSRSGTAWLEGDLCMDKAPPIPVIFELGAGRDHLVFEIEFSCTKGRLRIGNGIFEVWESLPSPYAEQFRSLKKTGNIFDGPTGYFSNMIKDAVLCVNDPQKRPVSSAADGLKVIEYLNSVKAWR